MADRGFTIPAGDVEAAIGRGILRAAAGRRLPSAKLTREQRCHLIDGAVLALLSLRSMRASEIGAALFPGEDAATGRARGRLLAMRKDGLADANVEDDRARWRITPEGRAWFSEAMRVREDEGG